MTKAEDQDSSTDPQAVKYDIWRDSLLRYLGYANEVGESFRPVFPRYVVPSYVVAFGYVGCDTVSKIREKYTECRCITKAAKTGLDAFIWQTLASVLIPGYTIRVVTSTASYGFNSPQAQKIFNPRVIRWSPTMIGLAAIPVIIHPIDHFVDWLMDNSVRKLL